ncbi:MULTISPECIES: hypothetical protein [unclassified Leeuwenhoekiella]|uniref:hypothetical protein n=1 Tax=unclassified Leeuwenhoekiella TaxID=2615029 RepID=UPI000C5A7EE6|nr:MULTISPECIES: hypothetical protein [unclassified Leeuwenhoekiella]MAW95303.1 hypothetical protein [Leeuwenhoekiella sp.]MBA81773.1 hypothetical protein [Leeuwenhoekiella sp.]|tara:strand:+ start:1921 stop:2667 length:747 start_codon:yes stop_codon:yes gene_type:complete
MKTLLLSSLLLCCALSFAQTDACSKGDCKNGYGFYYDKGTGEFYHGFYKDGAYNGVGYTQNAKNDYYWSTFKDGKPNGFTVYGEGQGRTWGHFENGVKTGDHIREIRGNEGLQREVITYNQGTEVSRKTYTQGEIQEGTCISGDCANGFGMYYQNRTLIFGKFKDYKFIEGEMMHIDSRTSDFFKTPVETSFETPYFKYSITGTDNGTNEAGYMSIGPKANGEYVMLNLKQNLFAAALFKDNQMIERF